MRTNESRMSQQASEGHGTGNARFVECSSRCFVTSLFHYINSVAASAKIDARGDALGDCFGAAVGGAGNAAADRFAEDDEVRLQLPRGGAAARPGADRVRFIGDEERAVALGELLRLLPVAVVGENDADVGH